VLFLTHKVYQKTYIQQPLKDLKEVINIAKHTQGFYIVTAVACVALISLLFVGFNNTQTETLAGQATKSLCIDSDDGIDIHRKGTVMKGGSTYMDYCSNEHELIEYYCDNNMITSTFYITAAGNCEDGRINDQRHRSIR